MNPNRFARLALVTALLATVGCGGDDNSQTTTQQPAAATPLPTPTPDARGVRGKIVARVNAFSDFSVCSKLDAAAAGNDAALAKVNAAEFHSYTAGDVVYKSGSIGIGDNDIIVIMDEANNSGCIPGSYFKADKVQ